MTEQYWMIEPLQPADVQQVLALIEAGLTEHWGMYDASLNPDLSNLQTAYAGADFLVARQGDRVIGCGALVPEDDGTVRVVRMSVTKDMRRRGVASDILRALIVRAKERGAPRIVLETTKSWVDARGLYEAFGFRLTRYKDGDAHYMLAL